MNFPRCDQCGKFLKNVTATVNGFDEIVKVEGECKKHGVMKTNDWEYWDFYPGELEPEPKEPRE